MAAFSFTDHLSGIFVPSMKMTMRFISFVLLFIYFGYSPSLAQDEEFQASNGNPYKSVKTHLFFLQNEHYSPSKSAISLYGSNNQLAVQLKQIMDSRGLFVNLESIPEDSNYYDSSTRAHIYVLFPHQAPEIYLKKYDNKWLYSKQTVDQIPELYKATFPFGSHRLVNLLPQHAHFSILGLQLWQLIGLIILVLLAYIFYRIASWITNNILVQSIRKVVGIKETQYKYVLSISHSIAIIIVLLLIQPLFPILQLPVRFSELISKAIVIGIPAMVVVALYQGANIVGIYLESMAEKTESKLDDQLVPLTTKLLKVLVVSAGILFILQNLDFDITALLAGISIGGLALALAAQDTLKNLFGSITIFVDRPFQVGDWIVAPGIDGTVEEVGFRSTRIRTFANSLVYVPNGKLADMTIDNMGLRNYRRLSTKVAITYDTPPDLIESFVAGIKTIIEEHPDTWKGFYQVRFSEMADFSLNLMVYCFFDVPTWDEELRCKEEVYLSITRLADKLGVRFAFPTQTLHVEEFPEKESSTPQYTESREDFDKKVAAFIESRRKTKD